MIFSKVREVQSPKRANPTDAGIDFFIPEYSEDFAEVVLEKTKDKIEIVDDTIFLRAGHSVLIPLGIKVIVDSGQALVAFNKSGVASKQSLLVGACVVDQGYTSEVHLNLHNVSNETQQINFGAKAIQFLQLKIDQHIPTEVTEEEYVMICERENNGSNRGSGGFGSTGV